MSRVDDYVRQLQGSHDWKRLVREQSGLPGPRGNLELLQAVVETIDPEEFFAVAALGPEQAPGNTPDELLVCCGVVGLARLIARGQTEHWLSLSALSADSRWRVREGVAMALQRLGRQDWAGLVAALASWIEGSARQRRAVVAGLCEPDLLADPAHARETLAILDRITRSLLAEPDRRDDAIRSLRQALGYGWSVAVAALPQEGKALFAAWAIDRDADVRWIVRENLRKKRLLRLDEAWVQELGAIVSRSGER